MMGFELMKRQAANEPIYQLGPATVISTTSQHDAKQPSIPVGL